jgi:hypothetical protein
MPFTAVRYAIYCCSMCAFVVFEHSGDHIDQCKCKLQWNETIFVSFELIADSHSCKSFIADFPGHPGMIYIWVLGASLRHFTDESVGMI